MPEHDGRIRRTLSLLGAYRPAPVEAEAYQAMMDLLARTPTPFSRHQFEPGHFTAGGFVMDGPGENVLMVEHRRLRRWLQPGGHIDPTDTGPEAAARREIAEETGVEDLQPLEDGIFAIDVHAIPAHGAEPGHHHFDVLFAFTATRTTVDPSPEVSAVRWVALADVESLDVDEATLRAVIRLRALVDGT